MDINWQFTQRSRVLNKQIIARGPIVYWMSRDQRVQDNWALLHAQKLALELQQPLIVVFCLQPEYLAAGWRQFKFMLEGLAQLPAELEQYGITFQLLLGDPRQLLPEFVAKYQVGAVICDFSPLRLGRNWRDTLAQTLAVSLIEVDAHNIVPVWHASPKQEFAARTFRPKLQAKLSEYLVAFPQLIKHPYHWLPKAVPINWAELENFITAPAVSAVDSYIGGKADAEVVLDEFLELRLGRYASERNNPNQNSQSQLSPYLHFGQIAPQRVALEVVKIPGTAEFMEELIVRRELADNFCFYNPNYDKFSGFPAWAQKTLSQHRTDKREFNYSLEVFEAARTHDALWNAAQTEMLTTGKMHGYVRMYWAKKILEWTDSPQTALQIAIYLNDKYELDGRDPNGYTGIAWSIGGLHDRPWFTRPIFGLVRYMALSGMQKKFDVVAYIETNS